MVRHVVEARPLLLVQPMMLLLEGVSLVSVDPGMSS